ncbi:hypothetical protein DPQ33_05140 [Oceanidesulfovibrio indonesiensis]|uniref:Outer membrane lipoprotein BamD-like domain-containing protein n=1 Tax=Oceanidesulfovibrio indonesiensis TaxID=54767 RepID=A0A7M3MH76_9BACT|nr:hypothetical protein DPQ33_05140 [Oceanidesulfovibrio indonesiensis]
MVFSPVAGTIRTLLLTAFVASVVFLAPVSAHAFNYYWGTHPDKDRIVVKFDGDVPRYTIARTGETTLDITLPEGFWAGRERPPGLLMATAANADRIEPTDAGLRITLKDKTFGYIHFVLEDAEKLVVDVFEDPLGARWEPVEPTPAADVEVFAESPVPEPLPEPETAADAEPAQETLPTPATVVDEVEENEPATRGNATGATMVEVEQEAPASEPEAIALPQLSDPPSFTFRAPLQPRERTREEAPEAGPAIEDGENIVPAESPEETRRDDTSGQEETPVPPDSEAAPSEPAGEAEENVVVIEDDGPSFALRAPMPRRGEGTTILRRSAPEKRDVAGQAGDAPAITPPAEYIMGDPPAENATAEAAPPPPPFIDTETARQAQAEAAQDGAAQGASAEEETPQEGPAPETLEQTASTQLAPTPTVADSAAQEQNRTGPDGEPLPSNEELLQRARLAFVNEQYAAALRTLDVLRTVPGLTDEEREEVLYFRADSLYALHRDDLRNNYEPVTSAFKEAMNFDPNSTSMPQALLKMGVINLEVNNPREAEAYFNILRNQYAGDPNIPLTYFYWGEYYFDHGRYQDAADSYQYIIQQYPDSRYVRESGVGLARSLERLGFDEQAAEIVDYLEKRWPRFYVEYPPFLRLVGDVSYHNQEYEKAKLNLWTFYNLDPEGDEADLALARIGDIYVQEGKVDAAREVYQNTARKYPDREGGLIARMRLAEEGIYDAPSTQDMFTVFDQPYTTAPEEIYKEIVAQHPDSALAPLAQLKLSMWYLYHNQQRDALVAVQDFLERFPESPLLPRAREVAAESFGKLVDVMVAEENYGGAVRLWDGSPTIRENVDALAPETRIALGLSFWKEGRPEQAWNLVSPFLEAKGMPEQSEMALNLALSVALEYGYWDRIVELQPKVDGWEVSPKTKNEFAYALALAYENLGRAEESSAMWTDLTEHEGLDPLRRGYAQYFAAVNARKQGDLKKAYDMAQDSLEFFLESSEDEGKVDDLLAMLVEIADSGGRLREAINWNMDYLKRLQPEDSRWAAARYRMAQLYRKTQDFDRWRSILKQLSEDRPDSLYGRMAAMDLRTHGIEKNAREFAPNL